MIKFGTWKGEPASEDGWSEAWSLDEAPIAAACKEEFDLLFGPIDERQLNELWDRPVTFKEESI